MSDPEKETIASKKAETEHERRQRIRNSSILEILPLFEREWDEHVKNAPERKTYPLGKAMRVLLGVDPR